MPRSVAGRRRKDGTSVPASGPISDSDLPTTQSSLYRTARPFRRNWGAPMGTLHSLIKQRREFVDVLLPRLEEAVTALGDGTRRQGSDNDVISLLEANAR